MNARICLASWAMIAAALSGIACAADHAPITIRTETYPRPPYSGATYYVYEQDGKVICTKLAVCDKYDQCDTTYHAGAFKDPEDAQTGKPYGSSPAVTIQEAKLRKHQCLAKFVPDAVSMDRSPRLPGSSAPAAISAVRTGK
ncbi:MAG: hypothetical protein E5299_01378 [Burkholderia gladioli]|nr:MAG: hypothetical protein E5299_01378 [Burkholderia gladioli]